ncbi:MAG: YraN family protein [Phycisphaerales bacterium]|jgi:putative endonuclease|nr:YraN family protein [Phycisphaerales bacterium]
MTTIELRRRLRSLLGGGRGWSEDALRKRRVGVIGERAAARACRRAGMRVIGRNLRLSAGEVDLLCLERDRWTLVVVEVKAGRVGAATPLSSPEQHVDAGKARTLQTLCRSLARANGWTDRPWRIDVVGVDVDGRGRAVRVRRHRGMVPAPQFDTPRP